MADGRFETIGANMQCVIRSLVVEIRRGGGCDSGTSMWRLGEDAAIFLIAIIGGISF